jgi:hypothetical protein
MRIRRLTHSSIVRTLVTIVTSACIGGNGSGLIGVAGDGGGTASGVPPVLSFFAPPGNAGVGQTLPVVQVAARDSLGNVDTTFTGVIRVTLASNASGAGLHGATAVRAEDGIATFAALAIDKAGTYTLRASTSGAADITSGAFTITTVTTP